MLTQSPKLGCQSAIICYNKTKEIFCIVIKFGQNSKYVLDKRRNAQEAIIWLD